MFRLERWHRWTIYGVGMGLLLTGLLWLVAHYLLRTDGEFGETVHPLEHLSMQMHGGASMVAWFFVGSLLNNHIRRANNARRNRVTGWLMITMLVWLSASGYGLYYLVTESSRAVWSWSHWVSGILLPFLLIWHISAGRRSQP